MLTNKVLQNLYTFAYRRNRFTLFVYTPSVSQFAAQPGTNFEFHICNQRGVFATDVFGEFYTPYRVLKVCKVFKEIGLKVDQPVHNVQVHWKQIMYAVHSGDLIINNKTAAAATTENGLRTEILFLIFPACRLIVTTNSSHSGLDGSHRDRDDEFKVNYYILFQTNNLENEIFRWTWTHKILI